MPELPLSNETFYFELNDTVNRFVLIELKNQLTPAQRKVLDDIHALLWEYCNTVSE